MLLGVITLGKASLTHPIEFRRVAQAAKLLRRFLAVGIGRLGDWQRHQFQRVD